MNFVLNLMNCGCKALFVKADLSKPEDCQAVVKQHAVKFNDRCDGLVHCAAMTQRGTWKSPEEAESDCDQFGGTDCETFDQIYALNVRAPFLLMQGVASLMRTNGNGGSIVTIGSVHAHGGMPKLVAYESTLNGNYHFSIEYQRFHVRC